MLKNENKSKIENIIIWVLFFNTLDNSLTGKKPPEDIIVNAKFKESNVLIDIIFKIIKINKVNKQYNKKILILCFKSSELLNDR